MKTHRRAEALADEFAELDRLVLHEFEALGSRPAPPGRRPPARRPGEPSENGAVTAAEREEGPPRAVRAEAGAEEGLGEAGLDAPAARPGALLDKEEAAFVRNVVRWLSERPNRDDLIARIWTELTEADPDAYYHASPGDTAPDAADVTPAPGREPETDVELEEPAP